MSELISIIVPAYNIETYVGRTLDSLLVQTYPNIEIIVVNDGSTDNTKQVLDDYATKHPEKIKVFHIENGGVTNARLTGVKKATGQWIGFCDGDDIVEPDMYELLLNNAQKYKADISHCGYKMVFPSREDLYYGTGKIIEQDNLQGQKDLLEGGFVEPGLWNKIYKKNIVDNFIKEDLMDKSIRNTEDLLMNYYLFRQSRKSIFEDKCLYHYVLRAGSATSKKISKQKLLDPLKVIDILLAETKGQAELQDILTAKKVRLLISLSTMAYGENKEIIQPVRKDARKELRSKLGSVVRGRNCGIKLKIMTLWAWIWPWSYGLVHRVYGRISGVDKKYEIK